MITVTTIHSCMRFLLNLKVLKKVWHQGIKYLNGWFMLMVLLVGSRSTIRDHVWSCESGRCDSGGFYVWILTSFRSRVVDVLMDRDQFQLDLDFGFGLHRFEETFTVDRMRARRPGPVSTNQGHLNTPPPPCLLATDLLCLFSTTILLLYFGVVCSKQDMVPESCSLL